VGSRLLIGAMIKATAAALILAGALWLRSSKPGCGPAADRPPDQRGGLAALEEQMARRRPIPRFQVGSTDPAPETSAPVEDMRVVPPPLPPTTVEQERSEQLWSAGREERARRVGERWGRALGLVTEGRTRLAAILNASWQAQDALSEKARAGTISEEVETAARQALLDSRQLELDALLGPGGELRLRRVRATTGEH
jgi:hypothetical protein